MTQTGKFVPLQIEPRHYDRSHWKPIPTGKGYSIATSDANPRSFHLKFAHVDDLVGMYWTPEREHQGWPGIIHGGISSFLLDDLAGCSIWKVSNGQAACVTRSMLVRYFKPVKTGVALYGFARAAPVAERRFEATASLHDLDGALLVGATAEYVVPSRPIEGVGIQHGARRPGDGGDASPDLAEW